MVVEELFELAEENYKRFNENVVRGSSPIIGVRIPKLRKIAENIVKGNKILEFFREYEGKYFEEKLIKGVIIASNEEYFKEYGTDYNKELDSWCLVDTYANSCKFIGKKQDKYWSLVKSFLDSKEEFIIRLGYVLMLNYFLTDKYIDDIIELCKREYDEYYVNMAIAWLISEAYISFPKKITNLFKARELSGFVHEKSIDKINDSFRVSNSEKRRLRELK